MIEQELRDVEKALAPSKIYYLDGTMSKIDYAGIGLAQNFHLPARQSMAKPESLKSSVT